MSLDKWTEYGWLKKEPSSKAEIKGLLTIADRDLKDAAVSEVSTDRRFEAAFGAARTMANIALRASGYRTSAQAGHHIKTIESLELTLGIKGSLIQVMKSLSKKRNATSYEFAGNISAADLEQAIKAATQLRADVTAWLKKHHPDLIS